MSSIGRNSNLNLVYVETLCPNTMLEGQQIYVLTHFRYHKAFNNCFKIWNSVAMEKLLIFVISFTFGYGCDREVYRRTRWLRLQNEALSSSLFPAGNNGRSQNFPLYCNSKQCRIWSYPHSVPPTSIHSRKFIHSFTASESI